jgi:hypothetical protein
MVGPQTTRNGVVAIDPHTTRSGIAWDRSVAWTNDDISRFGMMPSYGGVRRSTENADHSSLFSRTSPPRHESSQRPPGRLRVRVKSNLRPYRYA